jgi:hypothetical protein
MYRIKNSDKSTETHKIRDLFDNKRIIDLIAGEDHVLALTEDGYVYSCGSTTYGATGRSSATNNLYDGKNEWGKVYIAEKVTQISVGRLFSYALVGPRKCYSFGVNNCAMVCELFISYSKLGLKNDMTFSYHSPKLVHLDLVVGNIKRVHCGGYNCILETSTILYLFLTTIAHGYYGVGSHSDGAMYYNNRTFAPSEWKLMDQPFTTDGTVFKIAPGHCQSIVYIGAGTLFWKFLQ